MSKKCRVRFGERENGLHCSLRQCGGFSIHGNLLTELTNPLTRVYINDVLTQNAFLSPKLLAVKRTTPPVL